MRFFQPNYFPKQLFFRFVALQMLGLLPTLLVAAILARAYVSTHISALQTVEETAALFDKAMFFLASFTVAAITGISLWTGYRLVLPLGRILVKARSIQRRDYAAHLREEEPAVTDEPSEWSDLETTLHKIEREMQSKDRSLLREREQVETVMSALTEAVAAVDQQGNMLFYNSQFALLFGPGPRDSRLSDFIRSPDVLEGFWETLKDGKARQIGTQLRLKGKSNARYFSLSIAPLQQGNEKLYGVIGVFHDLSELRRMDQVRIDFVANVSHELRTPLTAIKGYAQTLKEDLPEGNSSRRFLETIERNTDRLIALVHDLLNLSSLESGADIEREEIRTEELTARVLAQLESLRASRRHEIAVISEVPTLWADPKRMEQVIFNLVENSIKYVPPGGKITVEWAPFKDTVQLRVSDNGPGIPPEHHSRVFERFYRVDSSRSRDQGGTGLGLAIVKHIMQRHGGNASVQSGPDGRGAVFLCSFPLGRES
jgi:two-component system phosphate regulon sensor histidine kinase PhoR